MDLQEKMENLFQHGKAFSAIVEERTMFIFKIFWPKKLKQSESSTFPCEVLETRNK